MIETIDITHPHLAEIWHPDNPPMSQYTYGSQKKMKWVCTRGHEHTTSINNKTRGNRCPYCSGYYAWPGETDLATLRPEIAAQWHPANPDGPEIYTLHSESKVRWICEYGHDWYARVHNRTKDNGTGCPTCARNPVSKIETNIMGSFSRYTEVRPGFKIDKYQVDILMPKYELIVEYDGFPWHENRMEQDISKAQFFIEHGYRFHRYRAEQLPLLDFVIDGFSQSYFPWSATMDVIDKQVDDSIEKYDLLPVRG